MELPVPDHLLIHKASSFRPDVLAERANRFGFSQASEVEVFAWALELCGQLQDVAGRSLVLKGGAAAQLYLPLEKQRASVDLDFVTSLPGDEVRQLLHNLSAKFAVAHPYFLFREYIPEEPEVGLPRESYFVAVPASLSQPGVETAGPPGRDVKVDILYLDEPLPAQEVAPRAAFALDLAFSPYCFSVGTLIGDKFLTLATESIGIPATRAADLTKQLYDLDHLTRVEMNERTMADMCQAIEVLVPIESRYRGIQVTVPAVIGQIRETLSGWAAVDLGMASPEVKGHITAFQGNYLRAEARLPLHGWAIRALRLRLVLDCVEEALLKGRLAAFEQVRLADRLEVHIRGDHLEPERRGSHRERVRKALLSRFSEMTGLRRREFKGRPLERIFWQMVSLQNMEALADTLEAGL